MANAKTPSIIADVAARQRGYLGRDAVVMMLIVLGVIAGLLAVVLN